MGILIPELLRGYMKGNKATIARLGICTPGKEDFEVGTGKGFQPE